MESDSDTENDNNSSDELLRYKMEMKVPESVNCDIYGINLQIKNDVIDILYNI